MTSNIVTVRCHFLCHDLYHVLGRHNSIDFDIGSGSGTVVDTVDREQAVGDTVEQVVVGIAFAGSFAAFVASVA